MNIQASLPAKYRGFSGALIYGLFIFITVAALAIIGGAVVWGLTGRTDVATKMAQRIVLFGVPYSLAAFLCRWLSNAEFNGLVGVKLQRGDIGIAGAFAGLLLAGAWTPTSWESALNATGEGEVMIGQELELSGPTFTGKHFDLAEHRGNVVVIDFWATWCGPCVKELPSVVALYEKHKDKGLRMVGVNLDNKRSDLDEFLQQRPLPWPQIMFDEPGQMGWTNPLVKKFGIDGIPYMIVVDREGKVAAADVRGRALESAVAKALGGGVAGGELPIHRRLFDWFLRGIFTSNPIHLTAYMLGGAVIVLAIDLLLRAAFKK